MFYHLLDPSGSSVTYTDETGALAGRVLFDPYGGVLENTLPATLTESLGSLPNADTGLAYLGNGRYYNPALGRPLQPNPAGGAPTVPQSLNRYAATSLGPVGVGEASSTIHPGIISFRNQMPGAILGFKGLPELAIVLTPKIRKFVPASTGIIEVVGPKAAVGWLEQEGFESIATRPASGWLRGLLSRWLFPGWQIQTLQGRTSLIDALADSSFAEGGTVRLGRGVTARFVARDVVNVADNVATQAAADRLGVALGVPVAGLLSAGIQGFADYNNPYLTPSQKWQRAGVSFTLGSGAAFGGLLVEYTLVGSIGGPVGVIAAIPIAISFDLWVAPLIFENRGLNEQHKLAPLNSTGGG